MQIISKVSLTFHDAEVVNNEQTGFFQNRVKEAIAVVPSTLPQVVPEWVRHNDLFRLALADKTVTEVVDNTPTQALGLIDTNAKPQPDFVKQAEVLQAPEKSNPWPTAEDAKTGFQN